MSAEEIDAAAPITIDVISDVVCPWCYVGKRRLEQALAMRPDADILIRWRPFQLDGTIPPGGMDRLDYMRNKFGSLERVAGIHQRLTQIGEDEGIAFRFQDIKRSPNTLNAHRLIAAAQAVGAGDQVVEKLFAAFFSEGKDIGDIAVLTEIASESGLDPQAISAFLETGDLADDVRREIDMAHQIGVSGVPFFIFDGKYAVSGAEAADHLATVLDRCGEERSRAAEAPQT